METNNERGEGGKKNIKNATLPDSKYDAVNCRRAEKK